jgi:acyl carrier protein
MKTPFLIPFIITFIYAGCSRNDKPIVFDNIKNYELLISFYKNKFEKIQKEDSDIQLALIDSLKKSFVNLSDNTYKKLQDEIFKGGYSKDYNKEILSELSEARDRAYILLISIIQKAGELETNDLDSIYARTTYDKKDSNYNSPKAIEIMNALEKETKTKIDSQKIAIKFKMDELIDSINSKRKELKEKTGNLFN